MAAWSEEHLGNPWYVTRYAGSKASPGKEPSKVLEEEMCCSLCPVLHLR